jgi:hypothetical protein
MRYQEYKGVPIPPQLTLTEEDKEIIDAGDVPIRFRMNDFGDSSPGGFVVEGVNVDDLYDPSAYGEEE